MNAHQVAANICGSLAGLLIFGLVYFLPAILGWKKANRRAILALNLLLGWTGIGWVVSLVWSLCRD